MLNTIRLLCITVSAGRSRSVKNAADTKHFAAPGLAKSKYRRFSRPASTAMHKRRSKDQVALNCNVRSDTVRALGERDLPCQLINRENLDSGDASREMCYDKKAFRKICTYSLHRNSEQSLCIYSFIDSLQYLRAQCFDSGGGHESFRKS